MTNTPSPPQSPRSALPAEALLPCPFCRATAEKRHVCWPNGGSRGYFIQCTHCKVRTPNRADELSAMALWNSRAVSMGVCKVRGCLNLVATPVLSAAEIADLNPPSGAALAQGDLPDNVMEICHAYESGFGQPHRNLRNPYTAGTDQWHAYAHGKETAEARIPASQARTDAVVTDAMEFASNVLAEIYAKYSVKIGPFATQAQKANGKLRAAIAQSSPQAGDGGEHVFPFQSKQIAIHRRKRTMTSGEG